MLWEKSCTLRLRSAEAHLEGRQFPGAGDVAAGEHGHGADAGGLGDGGIAHAHGGGGALMAEAGHVSQQAVLRVV